MAVRYGGAHRTGAGTDTDAAGDVVPASRDLLDPALDLYHQHSDKQWTLTDCVSFVIIRERGVTEALTGDRHFEQAGFSALLK